MQPSNVLKNVTQAKMFARGNRFNLMHQAVSQQDAHMVWACNEIQACVYHQTLSFFGRLTNSVPCRLKYCSKLLSHFKILEKINNLSYNIHIQYTHVLWRRICVWLLALLLLNYEGLIRTHPGCRWEPSLWTFLEASFVVMRLPRELWQLLMRSTSEHPL